MKLAKLSLAAIVVAGLASSSFAADNLADAFKNGKVSGELRAWYFDRDRTAGSSDIFNTGLVLGYVTDSLYGFSIGATMQSSFAPFADADAKNANAANGGFNDDMWGSGAVLSEAYLGYTMKNTTVKIGRQFITTPLVAGSGSRMIKQAFEGATIVNTDLPQTTLVAGVVTKYQNRTSANGNGVSGGTVATSAYGDAPEFKELTANHDYGYTILAINKSITGVTLTGQWAQVENVVDDFYAEAAYAGKVNNFAYGLAANYLYSDYDAAGAAEGTMYGVKLSAGVEDFNAYVAYSEITDDAAVVAGVGGGAQPNFVKGYQFTSGTYTRDTTGFSVDANYNFKAVGLLVGARYTQLDVASVAATSNDRSYTDLYAVYNFAGALKGLSADVSYSDMGKDVDGSDFWFKANYKF